MVKQFGQQPSDLASPVPGGAGESVDSTLEQLSQMLVDSGMTEEEIDALTPEDIQSILSTSTVEVHQPTEPQQDLNIVAETVQDALAATPEEEVGPGLDFTRRAALSFARTQKERIGALQNMGFQVKRGKGNKLMVAKSGTNKFVEVDPESFEFVNDVFGDWFRDIFEGATSAGIQAGATAAGAAVGGPIGAGAGRVGGAFVGGAAANTIANQTAEKILGISRDPERMGQAAEAALSGAGEVVFQKLFKLMGKAAAGMFPGTTRKILGKQDPVKPTFFEKSLREGEVFNADEVISMINSVRNDIKPVFSFHKENPTLANSLLFLANDTETKAMKEAFEETSEKLFKNFSEKLGPELEQATVRDVLEPAVAATEKQLQKAVGAVKQSARVNLANTAVAADSLQTELEMILRENGIEALNGVISDASIKRATLRGEIKLPDKVLSDLMKEYQALSRLTSGEHANALGKFTFDDIGNRIDKFDKVAFGASKSDPLKVQVNKRLSAAARKDRGAAIELMGEKIEDPGIKAEFNAAMGEFHTRIDSVRALKRVLSEEGDPFAFAKQFTTNATDMKRALMVKNAFGETSKEWQTLKRAMFWDIVDEATDSFKKPKGLAKVDSMLKKKAGAKMFKDIFGPQAQDFKRLVTTYKMFEKFPVTGKEVEDIASSGFIQKAVRQIFIRSPFFKESLHKAIVASQIAPKAKQFFDLGGIEAVAKRLTNVKDRQALLELSDDWIQAQKYFKFTKDRGLDPKTFRELIWDKARTTGAGAARAAGQEQVTDRPFGRHF